MTICDADDDTCGSNTVPEESKETCSSSYSVHCSNTETGNGKVIKMMERDRNYFAVSVIYYILIL